MDFIIIATAVCIVFLITMPLLVASCANPPSTPEEIDGGVRHYVDTDAPKTIESTQIVSFCCEFSATNLEVDSSPVAGWYYTLYAGQDGGSYEARGGGEVYGERKFTPDAAFFNALQRIVSEYGFAQYNGQFYTVSGHDRSFLNDRFREGRHVPFSYFSGSIPGNDYTPDQPFTLTIEAGPYADANPGYKKLHIRSGGADNPREIVLRQKGDRQWLLWDQFLLLSIRQPRSADPWE